LVSQFDDFTDAVLAGVGPALLVGNSMGAATAVRAASRHPGIVKGLVAIDDPLYARHLPARLARHAEVPTYFWSAVGAMSLPTTVLRWATGRAVRRVMRHPQADVDTFVLAHWQQSLTSMREVAALGRYALQYAFETRTGHRGIRVVCPTLVVHGKRDRIIPLHASLALHQQIPHSELVVLPRSGHCPQLDDPTEVARLVLWLFSRISGRTEGACSV
jgi:pimeloyl-ACP methyl ester carboxylesterase